MDVSMEEIFRFTRTGPDSPNFYEGERITSASEVMEFDRIKNEHDQSYNITGVTRYRDYENFEEYFYHVKGVISESQKIIEMECSCDSEYGNACPHIIAILVYLHRSNWKGVLMSELFPPPPIDPSFIKTDEELEEITQAFCDACPDSMLAIMMNMEKKLKQEKEVKQEED